MTKEKCPYCHHGAHGFINPLSCMVTIVLQYEEEKGSGC